MSTYLDNPHASPPKPQRGATQETVLSVVRQLTDEEQRAAGLFACSTAIRQGWTRDDLADVLDCLGLTK